MVSSVSLLEALKTENPELVSGMDYDYRITGPWVNTHISVLLNFGYHRFFISTIKG